MYVYYIHSVGGHNHLHGEAAGGGRGLLDPQPRHHGGREALQRVGVALESGSFRNETVIYILYISKTGKNLNED